MYNNILNMYGETAIDDLSLNNCCLLDECGFEGLFFCHAYKLLYLKI